MKKCFVVSPIGEEGSNIRKHADMVMDHILTPVLTKLDYEVIRADKISGSQSISKNIISNIVDADLIIADLTGHNPNVFYELAVSHTLAKPTIQLMQKGDKIPFDLSHQRTIVYELSLDGAAKAITDLDKFINDFADDKDIENPVLDVISLDKINSLHTDDLTITTALQELTNEIKRMQDSIYDIKLNSSKNDESSTELTNNLAEGMSSEEKMGMLMMDKMMSNPKMSEMLLKKLFNS